MIGRLLGLLASRATGILAASLFVGLAFPDLARLFRPLLTPAVAALLFLAMLRVDWAAIARRLLGAPRLAAPATPGWGSGLVPLERITP